MLSFFLSFLHFITLHGGENHSRSSCAIRFRNTCCRGSCLQFFFTASGKVNGIQFQLSELREIQVSRLRSRHLTCFLLFVSQEAASSSCSGSSANICLGSVKNRAAVFVDPLGRHPLALPSIKALAFFEVFRLEIISFFSLLLIFPRSPLSRLSPLSPLQNCRVRYTGSFQPPVTFFLPSSSRKTIRGQEAEWSSFLCY